MRISQSKHFDNRIFCALLTVAVVLIPISPAGAATFCVQTDQGFQNALNEAEINGQDDTILLVRGTYSSPSSPEGRFYFGSSEPYSLTIEGDWDVSSGICIRLWTPSAANTIIDGGGIKAGLILQSLSDEPITVSVKYLNFDDGHHFGSGQYAGGLTVHSGDHGSVRVESNIFYNNQTETFGGGLNAATGGRLRVINNLFAANGAAVAYGAAYLTGNASGVLNAGVEIYNNTVVYNYHSGTGDGGLRIGGIASICYVDNNIFWGNEEADLIIDNPDCTLFTNDIADLSGTPALNQGAMSVVPEFRDSLLGQYQLRTTSPLVNKGIVRFSNYSMPLYDLDGLPRFSWDSRADIGAYEVQFLFYDGFEDGSANAWSEVTP